MCKEHPHDDGTRMASEVRDKRVVQGDPGDRQIYLEKESYANMAKRNCQALL